MSNPYIYNLIKKNPNSIFNNIVINFNFFQGAFFEILSNYPNQYLVEFIDNNTQNVLYSCNINNNCWCKCTIEYFVNYQIKVTDLSNNNIIFTHNYNAENKNVFISIESKSLGDTIAWFPYIEEFRKKHKCNVICSTFLNDLFEKEYPNINFIKPGEKVNDIYASYTIGWYYNGDNINLLKHPQDPKPQPLQKTSSDILGLDYFSIKPKITISKYGDKFNEKYICIANHATCQAKYWNNLNGWQEVVNYCLNKGYKVFLLSKEKDGFMENKNPEGIIQIPEGDLSIVIHYLVNSEGFIGLGSGLSWLSWACNVPTIVISGFSEPYTEEYDYRVYPNNTECTGCFNKYKLDAGDWNWCPVHKNTSRQFECSKNINSQQVIEILDKNIFNK